MGIEGVGQRRDCAARQDSDHRGADPQAALHRNLEEALNLAVGSWASSPRIQEWIHGAFMAAEQAIDQAMGLYGEMIREKHCR